MPGEKYESDDPVEKAFGVLTEMVSHGIFMAAKDDNLMGVIKIGVQASEYAGSLEFHESISQLFEV